MKISGLKDFFFLSLLAALLHLVGNHLSQLLALEHYVVYYISLSDVQKGKCRPGTTRYRWKSHYNCGHATSKSGTLMLVASLPREENEIPNHQPVVCKMEAQLEYTHIAHTFLHVWHLNLYAQPMLVNKISASELSRKFIKNALLVGLG